MIKCKNCGWGLLPRVLAPTGWKHLVPFHVSNCEQPEAEK